MSVLIEFPNGKEWFHSNWIFRQLIEDVIKVAGDDGEVEHTLKHALSMGTLFLHPKEKYVLQRNLCYKIMRLMKEVVDRTFEGKFDGWSWHPDEESRQQMYFKALEDLLKLINEQEMPRSDR